MLRLPKGAMIALALLGMAFGPASRGLAADTIVTIYSDRHQEEDKLLFADFTKETGIEVQVIDEDTDPLFERLKQEGAKSPADLLILVGEASLARAADAGLLRPAEASAGVKSVSPEFRDPNGRWAGLAYWARVIVYRDGQIDPDTLKHYEDLADPAFHDRVIVRSASSPYNIALVASMIAANGTEDTETWAHGLVANFARPPQGGDGNQLEALSAGEGDITVVNTRYWSRFAASDKVTETEILSGLKLVFPNQDNRGTEIDLVGAGVMKSAPHAAAAQSLLDFLLRADIQEKFAKANFEFPILPNVPLAPVLQALGPFKADKAAISKLGRFLPEAQDVMAKAGWE